VVEVVVLVLRVVRLLLVQTQGLERVVLAFHQTSPETRLTMVVVAVVEFTPIMDSRISVLCRG
jgi:hypothetical protein